MASVKSCCERFSLRPACSCHKAIPCRFSRVNGEAPALRLEQVAQVDQAGFSTAAESGSWEKPKLRKGPQGGRWQQAPSGENQREVLRYKVRRQIGNNVPAEGAQQAVTFSEGPFRRLHLKGMDAARTESSAEDLLSVRSVASQTAEAANSAAFLDDVAAPQVTCRAHRCLLSPGLPTPPYQNWGVLYMTQLDVDPLDVSLHHPTTRYGRMLPGCHVFRYLCRSIASQTTEERRRFVEDLAWRPAARDQGHDGAHSASAKQRQMYDQGSRLSKASCESRKARPSSPRQPGSWTDGDAALADVPIDALLRSVRAAADSLSSMSRFTSARSPS